MNDMKRIARQFRRDYDLNPVLPTEVQTGKLTVAANLDNILFGNVRVTVGTQTSHQTRNIRLGGEIIATLRSPRINGSKEFGKATITSRDEWAFASFAQ